MTVFAVGAIVGGRLRIDSILGAGGMGIVAAATHLELGHRVAVKVLREELAQNATIVERFIREARAVVNLRTEHVCRVFDVGRLDNGAPYIVMELLAGSDLAHAIAQRPLPVPTAVDYMLQACVALAEAHAAGIVHRDLKPANLFVTRRPEGGPLLKVLDFGIAKAMDATAPQLTATTGMMGSPGYMSPEQLMSARDVDVRTDIWALGVTLYQLVSGRMPFPAPTITEIAIKVAADDPAPLDVAPELRAVIFRCLEKKPERRYDSVGALAADLARFASSDGRRTAAIAAQLSGVATAVPTAPLVAITAPTAFGTADTMAPVAAVHTPAPPRDPTQPNLATSPSAPVRRARWPLAVGALVLVGATAGIMAAVNRTPTPAAAPAAPAPTPGEAVIAAPDAATAPSVAPPVRGGDPWAATHEPSLPPEEEEKTTTTAKATAKATEADEEEPEEIVVDPADLPFTMSPQMKEQMKAGCRTALANTQYDKMPAMAMNKAMCWCVMGDAAKAQAILDKTTDKNYRNAIRSNCAMHGIKLK